MNLAIQGHSTLGREVIELLKMLGGKNPYDCNGLGTLCAYHIIDGNIQVVTIEDLFKSNKYILYSLEGLLAKFPYKVGNYARLSRSNIAVVIKAMKWENDEVVYKLSCDDSGWWSVENLKPYREETMEERDKAMAPNLVGEDYSGKRFGYKIPQGYEFDCIQNNQIIIKPIKPQYPKTYEECCDMLGVFNTIHVKKLTLFKQLINIRNAYWKIAGEQMGLGKSWEPDWSDTSIKYCLERDFDAIDKNVSNHKGRTFAFPTEEMRDTFYENFKDLIENEKELL